MSFLKNISESIQQKRVLQHLLFWFAILLIAVPKRLLDHEFPFIISLMGDICLIIPQILASYFTAYFIFPKFFLKKKYLISILLLIVSAYVFSVIGRILIVYIGEPLVREPPFEQETLIKILVDLRYLALTYFLDIYSIVFIFLFVKYFMNYKRIKEKELTSKSEKVAAELKTLKAQLNPHFLFNTLNNIYVLSLENSPKAPKSIEKLSKILDHVLYRCNTKFVDLSAEIELIENYIELEKLRYDDRLQVNFNIIIDQEGVIAPLILLSLVENAFKHGAGEDIGSPKIDISLYNSAATFKFVITNTVAIQTDQTERDSIGLKNVKKQLNLIYPDKFQLHIDNSPKLFSVTVIIKN